MNILFNLSHQRNDLTLLSVNDLGLAHAMVSKICLDNGFPVEPGFYDQNLSFKHAAIYESVKAYVEEKLFLIPTPKTAYLAALGNLQFQLTLHN